LRVCLLLAFVFSACKPTSSAAVATPDLAQPVVVVAPPPPPPRYARNPQPRIDVHTHIEVGALPRAIKLTGDEGIVHIINLSGGTPAGLRETLGEAKALGHTSVFTNPDFREIGRGPGWGTRMAVKIKQGAAMGAIGVKISKGLGLGYEDAPNHLLAVDDKSLDPVFEEAGRLGLPIAIHTGDPKAFWQRPDASNERFDELRVHPRWSFFGYPVSWEDLYAQFERRVARHPKTRFIGVHFGNDPEDPARVAVMLDKHKNLYIDTAARVPEIGRMDAHHEPIKMRAFFERYQDRILFGTDLGVGAEDLMLGSTGETPPTQADVVRFFDSTWRWFETEGQIPSPTPVQGRWDVFGIALPSPILKKVYCTNAVALLHLDPSLCVVKP